MAPPFNPFGSTDDLIAFALSHPSTGEYPDPHWQVIALLHRRGTREIFDAATRLLVSPCPVERALGVNIHAQLGYEQQKPFSHESTQLLTRLLEVENNQHVIYAALIAFGHLHEPACVPTAVRFASHPDSDIRYAVAFGLAGQNDEQAINPLIALTNDANERVRDWATCALGSQTEWDSPALRAALWARVNDSDDNTRGEALKGLALRKDNHVAGAIIAELNGPDPNEYVVEAAEKLADPRLVPSLEALRERRPTDEWLVSVIETCQTPTRYEDTK